MRSVVCASSSSAARFTAPSSAIAAPGVRSRPAACANCPPSASGNTDTSACASASCCRTAVRPAPLPCFLQLHVLDLHAFGLSRRRGGPRRRAVRRQASGHRRRPAPPTRCSRRPLRSAWPPRPACRRWPPVAPVVDCQQRVPAAQLADQRLASGLVGFQQQLHAFLAAIQLPGPAH